MVEKELKKRFSVFVCFFEGNNFNLGVEARERECCVQIE